MTQSHPSKEADCPRLGKLFRPCRWEGRWNSEGPSPALEHCATASWSLTPHQWNSLIEKRTYVADVCRTCGKVKQAV